MSLNLEQMKLSGFEPDPDLKWEKIGEIPAPDGVDAGSTMAHSFLLLLLMNTES